MPTANEALLAKHGFFADLPEDVIRFLADHARHRRIGADQVLFTHGEAASHFYLLLNGRISIEIPAIQGPTMQVQTLTAGNVLGWSWLIPPYTMSFQARTDVETEVLDFDGAQIRERCEEDPKFGYLLFKHFASLMSERMNAARRKVMETWNPPGFA